MFAPIAARVQQKRRVGTEMFRHIYDMAVREQSDQVLTTLA